MRKIKLIIFQLISLLLLCVTTFSVFGSNDDIPLLNNIQEKTIKYFYLNPDFKQESGAFPGINQKGKEGAVGFIRDRFVIPDGDPGNDFHYYGITLGGTGMGMMALIAGVHNNYLDRDSVAKQILGILTFVDTTVNNETVNQYYKLWKGAIPHWIDARSGKVWGDPSADDNGADLVETSYFIQGALAARQYFNGKSDKEQKIRDLADKLWRAVDWNYYVDKTNNYLLRWHCSSDKGNPWKTGMHIQGFNECMITYLLAMASPTHPVTPRSYYEGWAAKDSYKNPIGSYLLNGGAYSPYVQYTQQPNWAYNFCLFWAHYSFLGFQPDFNDGIIPKHYKDKFGDKHRMSYFKVFKDIVNINRQYCIKNPNKHAGYGENIWGLTASDNPWGYAGQSPTPSLRFWASFRG